MEGSSWGLSTSQQLLEVTSLCGHPKSNPNLS